MGRGGRSLGEEYMPLPPPTPLPPSLGRTCSVSPFGAREVRNGRMFERFERAKKDAPELECTKAMTTLIRNSRQRTASANTALALVPERDAVGYVHCHAQRRHPPRRP